MSKITSTVAESTDNDLIWGAQAIGAEISRSASQVHYLFRSGALDGAVAKLGHRTLVGSRSRLRKLPFHNTPKSKNPDAA